MRLRPPILLLAGLLLQGCPTGDPVVEPETPAPGPGFTYGEEILCEAPVAGWDRFSEEGVERGLTEPMVNAVDVFGVDIWGRGGGIVMQDVDADGDLDIVASQLSGTPDLYANDGFGQFTLVDSTIGGAVGNPLALGLADLDGDDLPEFFFATNNTVSMARNLGGFAFADAVPIIPPSEIDFSAGPLSFNLGDVDGDEDLDLVAAVTGGGTEGDSDPVPDVLMLNNGDGSWSPGGLLMADGEGSITQVALFTDRDLDGDQDVFIPNDQGPVSAFYRNDDGVLVNDAAAISADLDMAAMGADNGDFNRDGHLDYCMSDVGPPRCLLSDGDGGYFEGGAALGLLPAVPVAAHPSTVGWGYAMPDLNGDGFVDAAQASGPCPGTAQEGTLEIPDLMWAGTDDEGFVDVTAEVGFGNPLPNYGLAAGDVDGDGYLDVLVAGPDHPPYLFMNSCGAGAWLEFDLVGPPENRQGYGARVFVEAGGRTRQHELWNLRGQAQGPARVHFGLGDVDVATRVTVVWPDGRLSTSDGVPTRRRVTVDWAESATGTFVPPEGDDDDATDDDDDDATDDDDDPLIPGDGELVVEGIAFEPGGGPGGSGGIAGLTAWSSHDPSALRTTNSLGTYTLLVPEDSDVTITVEGDGYVPSVNAVDTTWQRSPNEGLFHAMFDEGGFSGFSQNLFGYPPAPDTSMLWVQIGAGAGDILVGASVDLSADYDSVWSFGGSSPVEGNVAAEGSSFLGFGNVAAGDVDVAITTPGGETCIGRTSFALPAASLGQVAFLCE